MSQDIKDLKDELLTKREVARVLQVHPQTVHEWIAAGLLPAVRVGSKIIRVRRSALDAFLHPVVTTDPAA